ncbi:MAG: type IV pilus assembly protein PilM [Desulfovermiculus sp.]|nr:type IV pilus assembly protein PilM [Desulfovermiculus sp.]
MFSLPWKKKQPPTGLDCGQAWVKVVGFRRSRQGIALERVGRMPWKGQDLEDSQRMTTGLKTLYSGLQMNTQSVICSLAGHAVIIKRIHLTNQQAADLPNSLSTLAVEHIPFDLQDVCLDYQILDSDTGADPNTVLLVASKKKKVHEMQWIMSQAGLQISVVDVDGFALCNCFEFNYPESQNAPVALLDIGANQSTFCVLANHRPLFIRDAGFGGQQITDRLAHTLNLPSLQAETLKWQDPDALPSDLRAGIEQVRHSMFISWAEEIQRLLHYYINSLPIAVPQPQTLYLSGGGSLHPGLSTVLSEQLEFENTFLDPWRRCHIDDSRFDPGYLRCFGPQYAVAAGLALRGVS